MMGTIIIVGFYLWIGIWALREATDRTMERYSKPKRIMYKLSMLLGWPVWFVYILGYIAWTELVKFCKDMVK